MKKLLSFFAGAAKNDRRLLALCYAAFFLYSLVYSVYGFAEDRVQRMTGNVEQQTVAADAFTLTDLVLEDGTYVSQSPDPRMTLTDVPAYVRSVTVEAAFLNMDPGEFCLFYQPRPGMEEFDVNYRLWAHLNDVPAGDMGQRDARQAGRRARGEDLVPVPQHQHTIRL